MQVVGPLLQMAAHKLGSGTGGVGKVTDSSVVLQELAVFGSKLAGLPPHVSGLFKLVFPAVNGDMEQV